MRLILLASTPEELRPFLGTVRCRRTSLAGAAAWNFTGRGFAGLALLVGMGGARPGRLAAEALRAYPVDCLVLAGFGGALTALPPPGGIVVAESCWRLVEDGNRLVAVPFRELAPAGALAALLQGRGLPAYAGALLTTQKMTAKAALTDLAGHLSRPVLDLETAPVAAVAAAQSLPFLAVRTITDGAGEEIQNFLARIIDQHHGVPLAQLLPALLAAPRRVGYCAHLWRRSRLAGSNLAQALQEILIYLGANMDLEGTI